MGCFNTVDIQCPSCGDVLEYQSKAGSCNLESFSVYQAPFLELADLENESNEGRLKCEGCGKPIKIIIQKTVTVVEGEPEEDEEL